MKERQIRFNTAMVQAILAGRKTQRRQALKHQPRMSDILPNLVFPKSKAERLSLHPAGFIYPNALDEILAMCPFGAVGDRLWVRETFRPWHEIDTYCGCYDICTCPSEPATPACYLADGHSIEQEDRDEYGVKWRPPIHMPRWACRIILEITGVRVERLTDISTKDCKAEGYPADREEDGGNFDPFLWFRDVWNATGGDWNSNPWVWVVEFKVLTTNGKLPEA